ncbi:MAG: tetratricopeptide repeat protein, partial [Gammaproteobacteria bacterium]|nr:tetratricopeptide repeat protein [Gemmatimonadota bacterium]NIU72610.1 tetratricopeptide repeat protein [Gammaproteobacteria bacterium]
GELQDLERRFGDGAYEEVERRATQLEPSYPDHAELPLMAGRALLAQGRMRAAAEAFQRAVGLDPLSRNAHYHLGAAAARIGELNRAERAWRTFVRLAPDEAETQRIRQAV